MKKEKLKRIAKRITAFAAAVAMAATFSFPAEVGDGLFEGLGNAIVASAAYTKEYDISAGSVTIDQNGTFLIKGNGNPVGNTITVNSGITAEITLDNVNIVTSSQPAFTIANGSTGNVTIILNGTNILKTSKKNCAGLQKNGDTSSGTLTIKGSGSLEACGGDYGAGIGGGSGGNTSNITITDSTVTAAGGYCGAGIGGGDSGKGSYISIKNSTVKATSGNRGAGIGGGYDGGSGSYITITDSMVTATSNGYGAGIGGGEYGNGSYIEISNSTVTATCETCGAGIGGGYFGKGSDITITSSTVTATSENWGSGIGGGNKGSGSKITITDSIVIATSQSHGAGIGGGDSGNGSDITITSSTVTATSQSHGAGIGGGDSGNGSNITITNSTVTATGASGGAGIGNGNACTTSSSNLKINGGSVKASPISDVVFTNNVDKTVYCFTIPAGGDTPVKVDGANYTPTKHSDTDSNIYAYLPDWGSNSPHKIQIGTAEPKYYIYDNSAKMWVEKTISEEIKLSDLDTPEPGNSFDTSATINSNYTITSVKWQDSSSADVTNSTPGYNKEYTALVTVKPTNESDKFSQSGIAASVNGKIAQIVNLQDRELTVKYTFPETRAANVTGITVTTPPTNTKYYYGGTVDISGCKIQATYEDSSTKDFDVQSSWVSGFNTNTVGTRTATVTYSSKSATFTYSVIAVENIALKAAPTKTNYYFGDTIDISGCEITATYTDNSTEDFTVISDWVTGFDTNTVGDSREATITYSKNAVSPKTTTFTYNVKAVGDIVGGYYQISNEAALRWFSDYVNDGHTTVKGILLNDINVTSNWTPIGTSTAPFAGTFDGAGYTISGLTVNDNSADNVGLFGYINNGTVKKVCVSGASFNGDENVGGICGYHDGGTISECLVYDSTISGRSNVGGIAGKSSGKINNCCNAGSVIGSGIVGNGSSVIVSNCLNVGKVTVDNISGGGSATITDCYYNKELSDVTSGNGTGKTTIELTNDSITISDVWEKTANDYDAKKLYYPNLKNIKAAAFYVTYEPSLKITNTNTEAIKLGDDMTFTFDAVLTMEGKEVVVTTQLDPTTLSELQFSAEHNSNTVSFTSRISLTPTVKITLLINDREMGYITYDLSANKVIIVITEDFDAGTHKVSIDYNGTGAPMFTGVSGFCSVTIDKGDVSVVTEPTASDIVYGELLSASVLDDDWSWVDDSVVPTVNNSGYNAYISVDDKNFDYSNVDGYSPTMHAVIRTMPVTVKPAVPTVMITAKPEAQIPGKVIIVSAVVSNPNNSNLSDLPAANLTYRIGSGEEQSISGGSFVIPEDTAIGAVITVTAATPKTDNYAVGTDSISVIVTACEHTNKTLQYNENAHWYQCSDCGAEVDKEAHSEDRGTVTIEPTETTEGVKTYKCVTCGYVMRTETIPMLDPDHSHSYGTQWKSNSTSHWHECECGDKVDITAHISDNGVVTLQPTETSEGIMTYSCTVCDYILRTETIPALTPEHAHKYGTEWKSNSTSHWHECECGEKSDVERHISDGGKVTVQPTLMIPGVRTYSCTVCGCVIKMERIAPTGYLFGMNYPANTSSSSSSTYLLFTDKLDLTCEQNGSSLTLSWANISNADSYTVYYYNNGKYTELLTTEDTSATFNNLKNGSRYKFLVKYTIDGKLSPINYAGRAIVNIYYKPIVTASAECNSITLRWKAVPKAEKYAVYKYVDGKAVKLAEVKGTSAKITKLSPDTEYSYIVSAYVDGEWTKMYKADIVTVKTLAE